jgi:hypothetical protein
MNFAVRPENSVPFKRAESVKRGCRGKGCERLCMTNRAEVLHCVSMGPPLVTAASD